MSQPTASYPATAAAPIGRENAAPTVAEPYFQTHFPPAEFAVRRRRVAELIGSGAVAVVQGAPASGAFDLFRQTNEFFYLCGVEVPQACLLIEGGTGRSLLHLPPRDAKHERSEGPYLNSDDAATAARLTGVDDVRPPKALAVDLASARIVYSPQAPGEARQACRDTLRHARREIDADPWDGSPSREARFTAKLRQAAPAAEFRDLSPILDALRLIKSPAEREMMRRAGKLSALAVTEAMRSTKPGLMEFHLGAVAEYVYSLNGAAGGGYRAIVACGENIWNAHYYRNNCPLRGGELVLMDYAPDFACTTSDIGRMWPVNGKYSDEQRLLYGFMVEYHKTLLGLLGPGVTCEAVLREAAAVMRKRIDATRWPRPSLRNGAEAALAFAGHLSHPVGMAVHDVGEYKSAPLRPGLAFALDPQMWVNEERLYVRVEDTVLITENGCESLTAEAPLELDAVEALVGRGGVLQAFPPLLR